MYLENNCIRQHVLNVYNGLSMTPSQEELAKKCHEVCKQIMPIVTKIVEICRRPRSIGTLCFTETTKENIELQAQYRYLICEILSQCRIVIAPLPVSNFGWNQGIIPPGFTIIQNRVDVAPPPFLVKEGLREYFIENPTDFRIKCGDFEIDVHQYVMSYKCPYFDSLFKNGMKESETKECIIDPEQLLEAGTDAKSIEHLVGVLYTSSIDFVKLSHLEVARLMACANLYGFMDLKDACAFELGQRVVRSDLGESMAEVMSLVEVLDPDRFELFQMMKGLRENLI